MSNDHKGYPVIKIYGSGKHKELQVEVVSQREGWRLDEMVHHGVYVISNRDGRTLVIHAPMLKADYEISFTFHHPVSNGVSTFKHMLTSGDNGHIVTVINAGISDVMNIRYLKLPELTV